MTAFALEAEGISKFFPGVKALDNVSLRIRPGSVHALMGENGAGKSTLMKCLIGIYRPDKGTIRIKGEPVQFQDTMDALRSGISMIHQELNLVPHMTVAENIWLGREPMKFGFVDHALLNRQTQELLNKLNIRLKADRMVGELSIAAQQMVEIAKAFRTQPSVLILDEPTASLTERETEQLFALIQAATARGVGVIYITHRMSEIRRIGHRITVLRDGRLIDTVDAKTTSEDRLVELMTGRVISEIYPAIPHAPREVILKVENLTAASLSVRGATLEVRAGEIVGLAGLVGSGKSELARVCFGLDRIASGRVWLEGEDITGLTRFAARR